MVFLILFALFIVFIVYFSSVCYKKWKVYCYMSDNFKSPPRHPILGNLHLFPKSMPGMFATFIGLIKKYGKNFVMFRPGLAVQLIITDARDVETILADPNTRKAKKGDFYKFLEPWLGTGLLTSYGDKWFTRRKIITPSFHFSILEVFVDVMCKQSDILINTLRKQVGQGEFDIYPIINAFALDVICETSMGVTVNAQADPNSEYAVAVKRISTALMKRRNHPLGSYMIYDLTPNGRYQRKITKILHDFTEKVISERRTQILSNNSVDKGSRMNFMDILLHATANGKPLTNADIREEVDTFMFEGHDTTASGIAFTLYLLSRHPDIQEKVYKELVDVFGSKDDMKISTKMLSDLTYMDMVIKESLRILPPVPGMGRVLTEETVLGGVKVPAGISIGISIYAMQHDPDYYPDPEKFDPERFNPSNEKSKYTFSYVPFSAGGRNCVGQKFAMLDMKSSIAKILMNFKLLPGPEVILQADLILKASNGIRLSVESR